MHRLMMDLQALHDAPAAALKEAFLATDQEVGRGGVHTCSTGSDRGRASSLFQVTDK